MIRSFIGIDIDKSGRIWCSDGTSIYSPRPEYIVYSFIDYIRKSNIKIVFIEDYFTWGEKFKESNPILVQVLRMIYLYGTFCTDLESPSESIKIIKVHSGNTSNTCSKCNHVSKESRVTKLLFKCVKCNFKTHADRNASVNILRKGLKMYPNHFSHLSGGGGWILNYLIFYYFMV